MSCPISLCLLLLVSSLCHSVAPSDLNRSKIIAKDGAVASDHGQCSTIGRDILKEGGHAVDAAVATALCLGVVSPASSGIGGGAFMLVRLANGTKEAYDMRETAPKRASKNMYAGKAELKASGALSIAVPGELAGLENAWKKHGKIPWPRLVNPAAQIAQKGFKISPFLHFQMTQRKLGIMADKGLRDVFTSNDSLLKSGDIGYNKKLAKTLRLISKFGSKVFYNGSIGVSLIKDITKIGGILPLEDLRDYKVKVRETITANVMGVEILTVPPPSSGGASLSLILNILSRYQDLSNLSESLLTHREIESMKTAFAVRMNLGDPDFVDVKNVVKVMLSEKFAAEVRRNISDSKTYNAKHYRYR